MIFFLFVKVYFGTKINKTFFFVIDVGNEMDDAKIL